MSKCCTKRLPKMHVADFKRTPSPLDSRGQPTGAPTTVASGIPIGMDELAGRELEHAKQQVANATHRIEAVLDPSWEIKPKDYLVVTKASGRQLTVNIGHLRNVDGIDREFDLLCGEDVS